MGRRKAVAPDLCVGRPPEATTRPAIAGTGATSAALVRLRDAGVSPVPRIMQQRHGEPVPRSRERYASSRPNRFLLVTDGTMFASVRLTEVYGWRNMPNDAETGRRAWLVSQIEDRAKRAAVDFHRRVLR